MIDHLLETRKEVGECVAMVYFNHKQDRNFDLRYVLCAILRQVLEQLPAIPETVTKQYDRLKAYKGFLSAREAARVLFEVVSTHPHRVNIVIDALDECSEEVRTLCPC